MKKALVIFCTLVLLSLIITPLLPLNGEEEIYDNTIRLHVLANSDSNEDQTLKLKVRDSVLTRVRRELAECNTRLEAEQKIEDIADDIMICAQDTIRNNGYDYNVHMTLEHEYYPTREYEGVRMPAGTYLSLKIMIGEAQGKNWWCVLFPPLCTSSAKPKATLKEAGFTPSQIRILTEDEAPKYKIKFRLLELFEKWFS